MKKFKKLDREDMRMVSGGLGGGCPCKNDCSSDNDCPGAEVCNKNPGASCMGSSPGCNYNVCVGNQ